MGILDDIPIVGNLKQMVVDDVGDAIQTARALNRKFDVVADATGLWKEHDPKKKSFGENAAALGNTALNAVTLVPGLGAAKAATTGVKAGAEIVGKQIAVNSAKTDLKATKAALKAKGIKPYSFQRINQLRHAPASNAEAMMWRGLQKDAPKYFEANYMKKTSLPRVVANRQYHAAVSGKKAALSAARFERNEAVKALPGVAKKMKGEAALIGTGSTAAVTPTERRRKTGKKMINDYKSYVKWRQQNGF